MIPQSNRPNGRDTVFAPPASGDQATGLSPPIPEDGRILFFCRDRWAFGFLSHFTASPIEIDGVDWPTVEHFYQAQKSADPRYHAAIRACETAGEVKRRAAAPQSAKRDRGSWFLANDEEPRTDWMEVKRDLMRRAETAKYSQNPHLAERLLATSEAQIVEDSPHDRFWGTGRDKMGENWAGRIIMEVRAILVSNTVGGKQSNAEIL